MPERLHWDKSRRKLIKKNKNGSKLSETQVNNDYAQYIISEQLAEKNYFEEAINVSFRNLGISEEQATQLFKQHLVMKADQRATYAKVIHTMTEQMQLMLKSTKKLSLQDTTNSLILIYEVKKNALKQKDELVKELNESEIAGKQKDEGKKMILDYWE